MCGLIAVAGNLFPSDVDRWQWGLYASSIRGRDATGIAGIFAQQTRVLKDTTSSEFFLSKHYKEIKDNFGCTAMALIGHTRHATRGGYEKNAAHPFSHGNVTGAHNGVILETSLTDLPDTTKFPTDSESVIKNISKVGVDKAFEYLRGDWAFIWFNREDSRLYFTRNERRPLFYALNTNGNTVWLGSELNMLKWLLERDQSGVKPHTYNYQEVKPHVLYSIKLSPKGYSDFQQRPLISGKSPQKQMPVLYKPPSVDLFSNKEIVGPVSQVKTSIPPNKMISTKAIKRFETIEDVPIFLPEEIKEMPVASQRDYLDRIKAAITTVERKMNGVSMVAEMNWSDQVTWRKNLRESSHRILEAFHERLQQHKVLLMLRSNIMARLESYERIKEAHKNHQAKLDQTSDSLITTKPDTSVFIAVSPPLNDDLREFKHLGDYFQGTAELQKFLKKHEKGCVNCGEADPTRFMLAQSILLKGDMGYVCSNCTEYDDVVSEHIIPYAESA